MAKKKKTDRKDAVRFEDSLAELEQIVQALEGGQIGLADALARYEQGAKLLKECYKLLAAAERRIEILSGVDSEGNAIVEELDERNSPRTGEESTTGGKAKARKRTPDSLPGQADEPVDQGLF